MSLLSVNAWLVGLGSVGRVFDFSSGSWENEIVWPQLLDEAQLHQYSSSRYYIARHIGPIVENCSDNHAGGSKVARWQLHDLHCYCIHIAFIGMLDPLLRCMVLGQTASTKAEHT